MLNCWLYDYYKILFNKTAFLSGSKLRLTQYLHGALSEFIPCLRLLLSFTECKCKGSSNSMFATHINSLVMRLNNMFND